MRTPIHPIWDNNVDRLSERALLVLRMHGSEQDRTVGGWAMQKDGTAGMKELHNITMVLTDPRNSIGSHFGLQHVGILTEFFDIILGLNPGFIHQEWKFYDKWRTNTDSDGERTYPYTYGQVLHNMEHPVARYPFSQWDHTVSKLRRDMNTRHAGMFCWDIPCHERDFVPCTYVFHFQQIDGRLCLTTMMRSQDALKGWYLDCFLYSHLLMMMASEVGAKVGHYSVFQNNFHVYPSDFELLEERMEYYENLSTPHQTTNGTMWCPALKTQDKHQIWVLLNDLYTSNEEGKAIYTLPYLDCIENSYLKGLVALICSKYYEDEDFTKYLINHKMKIWYENIRREQKCMEQ